MSPPRLFAALPLPELLRAELREVGAGLARKFRGARAVPPENIHITLRFFGREKEGVERERLAAAFGTRFEALRPAPPRLVLSGFSAFRSLRSARVAWAGFSEAAGASGRLAVLREAAEAVAKGAGLDPESHPFVAHATLARFRAPTRIAGTDLPSAASESFAVPEVALFESTLTPEGAVYRRIACFPLPKPDPAPGA